eukprot:NODE_6677_length_827_cov_20.607955_g6441_i0.p2 GENE.NODE_6677_length_827_cov_20.607955_g6441_i0~~NODE_6677_length_827_cov_20.607955_g6441_i0.p2  ORF type:complete len:139 (-),score=24.95 NODE_6677_length_827_cov_20.607955_g6441_i0:38-454(-)
MARGAADLPTTKSEKADLSGKSPSPLGRLMDSALELALLDDSDCIRFISKCGKMLQATWSIVITRSISADLEELKAIALTTAAALSTSLELGRDRFAEVRFALNSDSWLAISSNVDPDDREVSALLSVDRGVGSGDIG